MALAMTHTAHADSHRQPIVHRDRQFDYVYDPLYTVSSRVDHAHALSRAVAPLPHVTPDFPNLFSVLPHFPKGTLVVKHSLYSTVPKGLGEDRQVRYDPPHVTGENRYKYFRRPILPYVPTGPGGVAANGAGITGVVWAKKYSKLPPTMSRASAGAGTGGGGSTSAYASAPAPHAASASAPSPSSPHSAMVMRGSNAPPPGSIPTRLFSSRPSTQQQRPATPGVRTVAVQTIYRDSFAQTDPYSPPYTLADGSPSTPEVLHLASLSFASGTLPVSALEIQTIERARAKREWEKTLPDVVAGDTKSFEKRLRMMEEMEMREWKDREDEIERLQSHRLALLAQQRESASRAVEADNSCRLSEIWSRKLAAHARTVHDIDMRKAKAVRKLLRARNELVRGVDAKLGAGLGLGGAGALAGSPGSGSGAAAGVSFVGHNVSPASLRLGVEKRDIIREYGDHGSCVYAPRARDGRPRRNKWEGLGVGNAGVGVGQTLGFGDAMDLETLAHLEESTFTKGSSLSSLRAPNPATIGRTGLPSTIRRELNLQHQLEQLEDRMRERRERQREEESRKLRFVVEIEKGVERPGTATGCASEMPLPHPLDGPALLLQRLLRGRALQQEMYLGKMRRSRLIEEVKTRHKLEKEAGLLKAFSWDELRGGKEASSQTAKVVDLETKESVDVGQGSDQPGSVRDAETGQYFAQVAADTVTVTDASDVTFEYLQPPKRLNGLAKVHTRPPTSPEGSTDPVTSYIANTHISTQIDFLTSQIHRLRAHQKIFALAKLADRTRKLREAEEQARRDDELRRQREEDEIMRQVLGVHHETVETWLEDVLCGAVEDVASKEAREQVWKKVEGINNAVSTLDTQKNASKVSVSDTQAPPTISGVADTAVDSRPESDDSLQNFVTGLVQSFLLPEVEKEDLRQKVEREQTRYLLAAHQAVRSVLSSVENGDKEPAGSSPKSINPSGGEEGRPADC
ncbi:hypothetical protein M427DRAFT_306556 [Gonapodya prolifera JEL478]|uniref:Cilia- and flagella-associated protein 91 n=1 Tax=Gonapodya prolifera (strain JEL478) TaxID=1344416 RepID=A0A139AGL7_GONPJ|nr:hypothetical protein M427DRAFT_306556 [Gonapodya prolifera JEL478]|eukprot:KXS15972.1 hypothetical protein M427DRAFT_306556 [Gonapodya prolifera JEL478]